MRLTNDSPLVRYLQGENLHPIVHRDHLEYSMVVAARCYEFVRQGDYQIFWLTKHFKEAIRAASEKMWDAYTEQKIQLEQPLRAVIFYPERGILMCFIVDIQQVGSHVLGWKVGMTGDMKVFEYLHNHSPSSDTQTHLEGFSLACEMQPTQAEKETIFSSTWAHIVAATLYMQYGEIETHYVHGERHKMPDKNILERVDLPIKVISSHWLTNTVRRKGFSVRGHFRFQRVGVGRCEHKLVWIEEFQKKGYNRSADRWKEMPAKNPTQ